MQQLFGRHGVGMAIMGMGGFGLFLDLDPRSRDGAASGLRMELCREREITMTNEHANPPLSPCPLRNLRRREDPAGPAAALVIGPWRQRQRQWRWCQCHCR